MDSLLFVLEVALGFALLLGLLSMIIFRIEMRIVPEEERLVIHRLGRFNRIAGPGPVFILNRLETVVRTIRVRDEPANYPVQGLFMYDIPFGFTLNFWRCFDLQSAADSDRETLAKLAQFDDNERNKMIQTKVREALVHSVTAAQQKRPLAPSATVIDRLLPIIPGLPECNNILDGVRQELERTLPSIGVMLNRVHPITIAQLHLNQDLIAGFTRNRTAELLRQEFPNLPEDAMLQVITSIEGASPFSISRMSVADNPAQNVRPEVRIGPRGAEQRVRVTPVQTEAKTTEATAQPAANGHPAPSEPEEHLSKSDLSILKRVPRHPMDQQRSA